MYNEVIKLSFGQLYHEIKDIFIQLKGFEIQNYGMKTTGIIFKEQEENYFKKDERLNEENKLMFSINKALFTLQEEDRNLIINEFYCNKPSWWMCYYSRSTYYRKQKKAMTLFLYFYKCCTW